MKTDSNAHFLSRRAWLFGAGALVVGATMASRSTWLRWLPTDPSLQTARFAAMGTFVDLTLAGALGSVVQNAVATIAELERRMTVFSPDSELSIINKNAALDHQRVSEDLTFVLDQCNIYHRITDGAFDPTVGPLMRTWGFRGGRPTRWPNSLEIRSVLEKTGMAKVDGSDGNVAFRAEGMSLDLGGIGKGYAADRAAETFQRANMVGLVNMGGDIRSVGSQPDGTPWQVGVRHPYHPERLLARLELSGDRAVATSGTSEQTFELEGRSIAHILDPRTGRPVSEVVSATVVADSAMKADAFATAACVLGASEAIRLFESLGGVEALLVTRHAVGSRVMATQGLKVQMVASV